MGALVLGAALSGCAATTDPTPAAGDLLGAPTQLHFGGQVVTLDAAPRLEGPVFRVGVRVRPGRLAAPLPRLKVQGVYVVTGAGVWNAPFRAAAGCATPCLSGAGVGRGAGLNAGEAVQVVLRVVDTQGRPFWLRDGRARISAP